MQVFNNLQASADDIAAAGEAFILAMYGAKLASGLDKQRYDTYLKTIAKQPNLI